MELLRFAVLGLASGAIFAIIAQALVLTYRASGILNLAQGSFLMSGAYLYYQFVQWGAPLWAAVLAATVLSGGLGALTHAVVIRPMHRSAPLTRVIATLGVLMVLQSVTILIFGIDVLQVPSWLPTTGVGWLGLPIGVDRYVIVLLGVAVTVGLWAVYRFSAFGRVTSAVAESPRIAAILGHSPGQVAMSNWAIGSALAGFAGTLVGPIFYLEPTQLTLLVVPGLAAALIGGFSSFPMAFWAALGIGVVQGVMQRYVTAPGWSTAVPFFLVLGWIVVRGRGLPLRSFLLDRLPAVGSGRLRPVVLAGLLVLLAGLFLFGMSDTWSAATTFTVLTAVVCMSIVIVTGLAGQLSLVQYVLAGVAAFVAARLSGIVPFELAVVIAVAVTAALGALVGIPSLRTRGVTLAVVTLGLADVLFQLVLDNVEYNGGTGGLTVDPPTLFGWDIDPLIHPERYGLVAVAVLFLVGIAIANLRRGATGRTLLAIRSNERAAAALGVSVYGAKLYAFTLAAAVAAIGGVLLAYQQFVVLTPQFAVFTSLVLVGVTVAGGVGMIGGAVVGALMVPNGVGSQLLHGIPDINVYMPLIGGVILLLGLHAAPDGLFELNRRQAAQALGRLLKRFDRPVRHQPLELGTARPAAAGATLEIRGLRVVFGGVTAVEGVDLDVRPGRVHGLIGPNGAGKTTVIDAVTGFVPATGEVRLDGRSLTGWNARRRARAGIQRSFQSLELFGDLTMRENLAVACDERSRVGYLRDLVRPGTVRLNADAVAAVLEFELADDLDRKPDELPFGRRRLVAIARAIAASPAVLLLDEPAAGLDDHEAEELGRLIRAVADRGIAVLLVEHRMDLVVACCDEVTVLRSGAVLTAGDPTEVLRRPEVLDAYLGTRPAAVEPTPAATST